MNALLNIDIAIYWGTSLNNNKSFWAFLTFSTYPHNKQILKVITTPLLAKNSSNFLNDFAETNNTLKIGFNEIPHALNLVEMN